MFIAISIIHLVVCITLILIILLQTGKGADLGAMLGGGGSNTLFGGSGSGSFLSKITTATAVVFMITCLVLAYISAHEKSVTHEGVMPAAMPAGQEVAPGADSPAIDAQGEPATMQSDKPGDAGAQPSAGMVENPPVATEDSLPADSAGAGTAEPE